MNELDPHRDVAPLVRTADLQGAAMLLVESGEVIGLEQHVRELGVGDPLIGPLEARADRLLGHHLVHREVLAHVSEELEHRERAQPRSIVQQQRARGAGRVGEIEESRQLATDRRDVGRDLVDAQQRTLR